MDLAELAAIRAANETRGLTESDLPADPLDLFRAWQADVVAFGVPEPAAMVLATTGADGRPRARNVLLRSLDERGFVWFTNYESAKALELAANPVACLLFSWYALGRQVIVGGAVERTSVDESDAYWATRPPGSQLAAAVSPQSRVIPSREWLDQRYAEEEVRLGGQAVARPATWGGYRLIADTVEFWHGRPNRMHDRLRYVRTSAGGWRIDRLAP
ncbi:MAG: pyridoxamine 5'-phosphate oxidase [Acidimicrobiales bacterium]